METAIIIGAAVAVQSTLAGWWANFKARRTAMPQPMKLRRGVYVPWGPVQKIELFLKWEFRIGMAWLACWVLALIYALIFDPSLIGRHHT